MQVELLRKLGLNSYESKAYLVLVKYGSLNARDIAKKSGVPVTAIYPNLKSLCEKKLISLITKEPLTYEAIDPEIGLKAYKELQKKELDNVEGKTVRDLIRVRKTGIIEKEEDFLDVLKGWHQSAETVRKLLDESQQEYLLMSGLTKKTCLVIIHSLRKAVKRGVNVRFIVVQKPKGNKYLLNEFIKLGVEIRYYPMKNFAVEVRDSKESVIVMRNPGIKDRMVLIMNNPDLARAHRDYFNSVWKKAEKVKIK